MNKVKMLMAAMVFSVATLIVPPKAHAFGIVNILVTGRLDYVGMPQTYVDILATTLCIAFLPICILDEAADGQVTVNSLVENGYSAEEATEIVEGQKALVEYLHASQLAITRDGSLSKEQVLEFVKSVPGVTPAYYQFLQQGL